MERELPKYKVGETWFIVDVAAGVIREDGPEGKEIGFREMDYESNSYKLYLDRSTGLRAKYDADPGNVDLYVLPAQIQLDPDGMGQKYQLSYDERKGLTDFDIIIDQYFLSNRLGGQLPLVKIVNDLFYYNYKKDRLSYTENPLKNFKLGSLWYSDEKRTHLLDYDQEGKGPGPTSYSAFNHPLRYIKVEIPEGRVIDPIGAINQYWVAPKVYMEKYLMKSPPRPVTEARILSAKEILEMYNQLMSSKRSLDYQPTYNWERDIPNKIKR